MTTAALTVDRTDGVTGYPAPQIFRPGLMVKAKAQRQLAAEAAAKLRAGSFTSALDKALCEITMDMCDERAEKLEREAMTPPRPYESPALFFARLSREGRMHADGHGGFNLGRAA